MKSIFHIDMNSAAFTPHALRTLVKNAKDASFDAILWEIEDKVRLDTCPECAHLDAMTKDEFRELLDYSRSLGLENIPLLQTLGHAEYVLRLEKYASMREQERFYDCYCASAASVRAFLKSMIREYIELFGKIELFHLGGDEVYSFALCDKCSAKKPAELYAEYFSYLAAEIRLAGARPCVWCDMLLNMEDAFQYLDRDFVIFDWNYSDSFTDAFKTTSAIISKGYDTVVCSASCSFGDSPFLPAWTLHARNIAGAALKARTSSAFGTCVTSWSVRIAPKFTQTPLLEIAPSIIKSDTVPTEDSALAEINAVCRKYYGTCDESVPERLSAWSNLFIPLTGVMWTTFKDSMLPPEKYIEKIIAEKSADEILTMLNTASKIMKDVNSALKAIIGLNTPFIRLVKTGALLKKRYLEIISERLRGESVINDNILVAEKLNSDFMNYLANEQTFTSAGNNAAIVTGSMEEYVRSLHTGN